MNNITLSFIVASLVTLFMVLTENRKDKRTSVGTRAFITTFFVGFICLTYFTGDSSQDIEIGEPNF